MPWTPGSCPPRAGGARTSPSPCPCRSSNIASAATAPPRCGTHPPGRAPRAAPGPGPARRRLRLPGWPCPAQWTDAHHLVQWADGGSTALHNLVLLCPRHHNLLHHTERAVTISQGFPLFHPPPWIPGGPRRNSLHRIDLRTPA
ncbi:HNH endonuclease signature motif containing protein [Pseudonocardia sp. H11422]|uniref:HNH endonuclease signature motif containing protein n=1 Tax=Pseudonocardia sp. H11422 TaxID=2835866 RepID=UPI00397728D7